MKLTIYSKFCIPCIYKDKWDDFQRLAAERGCEVKVVRTVYRPLAHKKATEIWGDENYSTFIAFPDGSNKTIGECLEMWQDDAKNKLVKSGKTKKKGCRNDLQRLRKAKRPVRMDRVADTASKIETEDA